MYIKYFKDFVAVQTVQHSFSASDASIMAAADYSTFASTSTTATPLNNSGAHLGHTVSVLCNVYALPVLCFIGILGNAANLITLNSVKLRSVSYIYLRALSAADLSCMIFVLIFAYFELVKLLQFEHLFGNYKAVWYRAHIMLPAINISVNAGILVVVLLTIERYICIAWPVYFRCWNVRVKAITLISLAYATALTLYLPMCWQMKAAKLELWWPPNNTDYVLEYALYKVVDNPAVLHNHYYKAYKWTRETLLKFIPIVVLAALNLFIALAFSIKWSRVPTEIRASFLCMFLKDKNQACENYLQYPIILYQKGQTMSAKKESFLSRAFFFLRKFKQRRSRLIIKNNPSTNNCTSPSQKSAAESVTNPLTTVVTTTAAICRGPHQSRRTHQPHSQQLYLREQRNLYILLTVVAVMFFVCNTPAAINLLLISDELKKSPGYLIFRALANFMEITNHALNFYVFCMCSEDYRRTFMATFPCVKTIHQRTTDIKKRFLTLYWKEKRLHNSIGFRMWCQFDFYNKVYSLVAANAAKDGSGENVVRNETIDEEAAEEQDNETCRFSDKYDTSDCMNKSIPGSSIMMLDATSYDKWCQCVILYKSAILNVLLLWNSIFIRIKILLCNIYEQKIRVFVRDGVSNETNLNVKY
uniref:G-protein coupled receptors family 1 profile domain-containing protein n=1 Tax=Romanomermis culicivorax TaxID=13658 RepID=A0A915KHV2_ROMCU